MAEKEDFRASQKMWRQLPDFGAEREILLELPEPRKFESDRKVTKK